MLFLVGNDDGTPAPMNDFTRGIVLLILVLHLPGAPTRADGLNVGAGCLGAGRGAGAGRLRGS